ncbi:unnamed protein product [Nippostrongylus brasiliensis]|uniref:Secreted protein n=1 Tax=Nippostrongylus brasiliensis TaxID=27835 RepID=A0A0N4XEY4_NIPBR|nr:unnamed protein product [Nippostrongylus brasiliensis]
MVANMSFLVVVVVEEEEVVVTVVVEKIAHNPVVLDISRMLKKRTVDMMVANMRFLSLVKVVEVVEVEVVVAVQSIHCHTIPFASCILMVETDDHIAQTLDSYQIVLILLEQC